MVALPRIAAEPWTLHEGDCLDILRTLPDASVDAVVTDPPAGIAFMGKSWDTDKGGRDAWIAWLADVMSECRRVMKPGAHAFVWALPRTSHWTGMALEDAGFEVRDACAHLFGSGFPKSANISKHIDRMAGAEREVVGTVRKLASAAKTHPGWERPWAYENGEPKQTMDITAPATPAAAQWDDWGTALKPSMELWWLARKPLAAGTVAGNVLEWGTGALNIAACRVESGSDNHSLTVTQGVNTARTSWEHRRQPRTFEPSTGRWPPNLLLSHSIWCAPDACAADCPVRVLGEQSGERKSGARSPRGQVYATNAYGKGRPGGYSAASSGSAARYFPNFPPDDPADAVPFIYAAKASRRERNEGCDGLPASLARNYAGGALNRPEHECSDGAQRTGAREPRSNSHPTVKSQALCSWLVRLITPPGGIVLDPFMGSGSTGVAAIREGFGFVGIERESEYMAIARARIEHAARQRAA